ncbi:alpha/beta-hydrolase [Marasmius fiardii PR-910]|nr:alpha/beta-hydrolase [Marasmius fiardii PR-910]
MIDHLLGRPSPSWKRTQVLLVLLFWVWPIVRGGDGPPRILGLKRANRLLKRLGPCAYAMKNLDKILGLSSPEPLAQLYSPEFYRATWIATGLDAGFATALTIRPKWLRDMCSILFSVYYIVYANAGDEKLRRFRAVPTVEMLRGTWEKTSNPYIRLITSLSLPPINVRRKILLPRPKSSQYQRPITAYLFYALPAAQLSECTELILDFPGGGFICMSPEHHEGRLRLWAINTGKPILSIDYGKAPEYPFPFATDEAFDTYRILVESNAAIIGMSGESLDIVLTGDSAGGTMACNVVIKTLEYNNASPTRPLKLPLTLLLNYAVLDFNFASWMTQDNLRILHFEQSTGNLQGLMGRKDHLSHISPLSMVDDSRFKRRTSLAVSQELGSLGSATTPTRKPRMRRSTLLVLRELPPDEREADTGRTSDKQQDKPLLERVKYDPNVGWSEAVSSERKQLELSAAVLEADNMAAIAKKGHSGKKEPIGTRLTLTSRTGYFQDRIVTPGMMRAMALLYVGPYRDPDFATNYYISPLLAPSELLAKFPPLLLFCGEVDPFNDDSILLAGRVREAKRARKTELDLAFLSKSARFGDHLRKSVTEPKSVEDIARMREERDKLSNEDDWVQLTLFAGWSHGYLQMSALMREAKAVIEDQADCIDDAFSRYRSTTKSAATGIRRGAIATDGRTSSVPQRYQSPPHFQNPFSTSENKLTSIAELPTPAENIESETALSPSSTDENVPKPTGSSRPQAGNKISETELMRRRRLLDAHIFE